jgi:hypothetical protein
MISALAINLRKDVWTCRGGATVELQQALSEALGFLPIVAVQKLLSFAFRSQP